MSLALRISITAPDLSGWRDCVNPAELNHALGKRLETRIREWFEAKPANAKGWGSTGFWKEAAASTHLAEADESGATVSISAIGVALRYFGSAGLPGGAVTPRTGKYLAIPLTRAARDAGTPREFPGLAVRRARSGNLLLGVNEGGRFHPYFALVTRAVHRPAPDTLPPEGDLAADLTDTAEGFIRRRLS